MKVCIVGASGKLGRYMVQHCLDRNYEVVGVW
jgi:putative NADH-flavin reductase